MKPIPTGFPEGVEYRDEPLRPPRAERNGTYQIILAGALSMRPTDGAKNYRPHLRWIFADAHELRKAITSLRSTRKRLAASNAQFNNVRFAQDSKTEPGKFVIFIWHQRNGHSAN